MCVVSVSLSSFPLQTNKQKDVFTFSANGQQNNFYFAEANSVDGIVVGYISQTKQRAALKIKRLETRGWYFSQANFIVT